jgi:hypothetical protein
LNGTNYTDWICNLRIILNAEKKEEVLDIPLPEEPDENAILAQKNAYKKAWDVDLEVGCLMLVCMEPDLQMQFESVHVHDMVVALNYMFTTRVRTERFNVSKAYVKCKLASGTPVGPHVIKTVCYVQGLEKLGFPLGKEFSTDFILFHLAIGTSSETTICMGRRRA